jgi:transposase
MVIIGCDFHPRFQWIAFWDLETGEYGELRLSHPDEAERFYRSLKGKQVRVGVEATGSFGWFRRLLAELGFEFVLGDAAAIRASFVRKQKTDKRDARHILLLLRENRFPAVRQLSEAEDELRQLLVHRCRMVRMATRVHNQLDSLAKSEGLQSARGRKGLAEVARLPLAGWHAVRRQDLLDLLKLLEERVRHLDEAVRTAADQNQSARLLMTHPGVGPVVSLAYVLAIGDWRRFKRGKNVASYLGLIPAEESSGQRRRLGHVSKQGNSMVRWLLVQSAIHAQRHDASWHRQYARLSMTKHHGVAKLAIAHKLAVRLYWMLRSGEDYSQVRERGSHAGQSV